MSRHEILNNKDWSENINFEGHKINYVVKIKGYCCDLIIYFRDPRRETFIYEP